MTVEELKKELDSFLRQHNVFDAWYERYRLDNLAYNDDVPIEEFLQGIINSGKIHDTFYSGIEGTCLGVDKKFLEDNKKCDILPNMTIAGIDHEWMAYCKNFLKNEE